MATADEPFTPSKRMRFTIDEATDTWLTQRREVTPSTADGYRTISVSVYSPTSSPDDTTKTTIPVRVNSTQTLELAGFSETAADEVFNLYERLIQTDEELELDTLAKNYIEGKAAVWDAALPEDDYRAAWQTMGMSQTRIERLMESQWDDIRHAMSASAQFKESVDATAAYVFAVSTSAARKRCLAENRQAELRSDSPDPGAIPSRAIRGRSSSNMLQMAGSQPSVQTLVDLPTKKDGRTMLYKGGNYARLEKIFYDANLSKLSFEALTSTPPTDFSRTDGEMFYTAKQIEVAEHYCNYKEIVNGKHVRQGILHVAMPDELIQRDDFKWINSPHWNEMIWACRGAYTRGPGGPRWTLPEYLEEYLSGFGLAGKICGQSNEGLSRKPDMTHITEMTTTKGVKAQHYVFFSDSLAILNEKCEGQVWLENRDPTSNGTTGPSSGKGVFRAKRED